jgi:hypothetical protein
MAFISFRVVQTNQPFPERCPAALSVISGQIHGDSQKPGVDPALAPKTSEIPVGPEKALLRQRVGRVCVLQQQVQYAVHSALVLPDDLLEAFRRNQFGYLLDRCVQRRRECGFHAPALSEMTGCYEYGRILGVEVYRTT